MRVVQFVIVIFGLSAALGCNASAPSWSRWAQNSGGLLSDLHEQRARRAGLLVQQAAGRPLNVRVLNSEVIGAYAWPDGAVFVTRGLLDALTDDELAAVIAHEAGHLIDGAHGPAVASLNGCCRSFEDEARADAIGAGLLMKQRISPTAMVRMLEKVAGLAGMTADCRQAVAARIRLLLQRMSSHRVEHATSIGKPYRPSVP